VRLAAVIRLGVWRIGETSIIATRTCVPAAALAAAMLGGLSAAAVSTVAFADLLCSFDSHRRTQGAVVPA